MDSKVLKIFYSWQSDLPNKQNRSFIESCLETAIKHIKNDDDIEIIPRIDRDTSGVSGSPNIASTILDKIDNSFLVISDVTIINSDSKHRKTPNPNVLYELGYAVKSLGINRVLMVQNILYGDPTDLPFDLKLHRTITYKYDEKNANQVRKELIAKLETAIKSSVIDKLEMNNPNVATTFQDILSKNLSPIKLEENLLPVIDNVLSKIQKTSLYNYSVTPTKEEIVLRKEKVEEHISYLRDIFFLFGRWIDNQKIDIVLDQYNRFLTLPDVDGQFYSVWKHFARYPALLLMYAFCLGAIKNKNIPALVKFLDLKLKNRESGDLVPIFSELNNSSVFDGYKDLTKSERIFSGSDELYIYFKGLFPSLTDEEYANIFDTLELLISIKYGTWSDENRISMWMPTGSYTWRTRSNKIWEKLNTDYVLNKDQWIYYNLLGKGIDDFENVFKKICIFIDKVSDRSW